MASGFAGGQILLPIYCTFAVTIEFAVKVNVQLLVFAPLLVHAPSQITSRPLASLSVITEFGWNCATWLVPVATLIPAGLETMVSPLRPPAVTSSENVVGAATGFSVSVTDLVTPPPLTEIVTRVCVETGCV